MVIPSYSAQFNYQVQGPPGGRKWVFLHGLLGSAANWRKITSGLVATECILTYDQRGHGRSFQPLTGYAPTDYAEDLYLISKDLGFEKFILVGHSMGGRNALAFAHQFPEMLEKLVIEDIGPESDPSAVEYYEKLLALVPTPFPDKPTAKEFFMNDFPRKYEALHAQAKQPESTAVLGAYFYSNLIEKRNEQDQLVVDWRFSVNAILQTVKLGRAKDQWDDLRSLNVPTLVIRGQNSRELSPETFRRILVSGPFISGKEISNAGHWVHSDQPEEFLRALKGFVFENALG
jgi:pimeloyl-ACP methyl ester carboxylesterase